MKTILSGFFVAAFLCWVSLRFLLFTADGKGLPHVPVNAWALWVLVALALLIFLFATWIVWLTVTDSKHRPEEANDFLRCIASLVAIWMSPVILTMIVRNLTEP